MAGALSQLGAVHAMVVHGAGVWSGMFMLPTVDEHFIQYLVNNGYDAWLLDWRASIQLPLSQASETAIRASAQAAQNTARRAPITARLRTVRRPPPPPRMR